jgi:hypothetical protein
MLPIKALLPTATYSAATVLLTSFRLVALDR